VALVGATHTGFSTETFIDELAAAAGKDPVAYRKAMLAKHPRHLAVLELAAAQAGWGTPLAPGKNGEKRGRGVAVVESFNTFVAEVAEVTVKADKSFTAIASSAPSIAASRESRCRARTNGRRHRLRSLSGALREDHAEGREVEQSNFHDYPVLRINEMPKVDVHIVPSTEKPTGVGEPGVPPIAPAVANALARRRDSAFATFRSSLSEIRARVPCIRRRDSRPRMCCPRKLPAGTIVFAFRGDKVLVSDTGASNSTAPRLPPGASARRFASPAHRITSAPLDGVDCVAVGLPDSAPELPNGVTPACVRCSSSFRMHCWRSPRARSRSSTGTPPSFLWTLRHRDARQAGERAKECPACGLVAYPRVSPAMMVLVTRGSEVLLARAHRFPPAMFSALAGFVEPGETIEDCIRREGARRNRVEVGRLEYFASQSWRFRTR